MPQNVIIYEVQATDTLESIAEKIGMSTGELLDFHNAHCGEFGLLWITGLAGIQKIAVPKNYKSAAQIRRAITEVLPAQNLSAEFFAEMYSVKETFVDISGKKTEITYETVLYFAPNPDSPSTFLTVKVHSRNYKKNGLTPDDKMSELAMACMEAIAPFAFKISPQGKILGIVDFKNLQHNFEKKKGDLQNFFTGAISIKYFERFETYLKNEAYFLQQYSSNLLHQTLLLNPAWFYNQGIWEEEFYLIKNSFPVSMLFTTTYHQPGEEKIQTIIKGSANSDASLQDLLIGRNFSGASAELLDADLTISYTTHQLTKQLLGLQVDLLFKLEKDIFKEHHLQITKI